MFWSMFQLILGLMGGAALLAFIFTLLTIINDEEISDMFGFITAALVVIMLLFIMLTPSKFVMLENEYYANQDELRPACIKELKTVIIDSIPAKCVEKYITFKADSAYIDTLYRKYKAKSVKQLTK